MPSHKTSPARSQDTNFTPRKLRIRRTLSVGSPARSNVSARLTSIIDDAKKQSASFVLSPLPNRKSILTDNTFIDKPGRTSWWKKLGDNSRDVLEVLNSNEAVNPIIVNEEYVDVLSQEKKSYTLDLPESSDNESINSIVVPQRRLFTQQPTQIKNNYDKIIGDRETLAKINKTNNDLHDKSVKFTAKNLFNLAPKRARPAFPEALLTISPNKTLANKTKEMVTADVKGQVRTLFGNRAGTKEKICMQIKNNYDKIIGDRDTLAKIDKTNNDLHDKSVKVTAKNPFNLAPKRARPAFPEALLTISPNKTLANKTKEMVTADVKGQVRTLFGNRAGTKRKNMFGDFIMSESEDEIPDMQPGIFGFPKKPLDKRRPSSTSRGTRDHSPTSSVITDMEMDDWKRLPSSTMVENQIEEMMTASTPVKKARISKLTEDKELANGSNTTANKTKLTNKSFISNNNSRVKSAKNTSVSEANKTKLASESSMIVENPIEDVETDTPSVKLARSNELSRNKEFDISKNTTAKAINNSSKNKSNVSTKKNKTATESHVADTLNDEGPKEKNQILKEKSVQTKKLIEEDEVEMKHSKSKTNDIGSQLTLAEKSVLEVSKSKRLTNAEDMKDEQQKSFEEDLEVEHNLSVLEENKTASVLQDEIDEDSEEDTKLEFEDDDEPVETGTDQSEHADTENVEQDVEVMEVNTLDKLDNNTKVLNKATHNDANSEANHEAEEIFKTDKSHGPNKNATTEHSITKQEKTHTSFAGNKEQDKDKQSIAKDTRENENCSIEDINQDKDNIIEQHIAEDNEEGEEEDNEQDEENDNEQDAADQSILEEQDSVEQSIVEENEKDDDENSIASEDAEEQNNESTVEEEQNESADNDVSMEQIQEEEEEETAAEGEQNESADNDVSMEQIQEEEETAEHDESEEFNETNNDEVDQNDTEEHNDDESEHSRDSAQASKQVTIHESENQSSEQSEESTPNKSHDTIGRHRNKEDIAKSPEAEELQNMTNQEQSFTMKGRNTSIRKTKTMVQHLNIKPSLAPARDSTGFSDGTKNSSAEGSGWDSHRTTRKTIRQTMGREFSPRKSLRALVMEKSAKRYTAISDLNDEQIKIPQANSTQYPEPMAINEDEEDESSDAPVSVHEVSKRTRQATLEMLMQSVKRKNQQQRLQIEERVKHWLQNPSNENVNFFKVPTKSSFTLKQRVNPKGEQNKPKSKVKKSKIIPYLPDLPVNMLEDMKYKPPKRYRPGNASWITKRLYNFIESKLEAKYDYKARIRAEKLVETIYTFTKDLRRHPVAPKDATAMLKREMARLNIVKTHYDFYNFFHDYMPREVRVKVVPDLVNKISLPKHGVFMDILAS